MNLRLSKHCRVVKAITLMLRLMMVGKKTLAKISEAHPASNLNKQYGKTKALSQTIKVMKEMNNQVVREKHKTRNNAKRRMAKQNPIK